MKKELRNLDVHDLIGRMHKEIIAKGPKYALPVKLPDYWLDFLLEKPDFSAHKSNQDHVVCSLVIVLFSAQERNYAASEEEFYQNVFEGSLDYFRELMCEYDYRKSFIYYERATVKSILNWRDIKVIQLDDQSRYLEHYKQLDSVHLEYSH